MNSGVRWAGVALAMLLAAPSLAQGTPPDTTRGRTGSAPGRGGIGGLIGASYFYASEDYSLGALPRFSFDGHFRYTFSPRFRGQVELGLTWSAYSKNELPPFDNPDAPNDLTKEDYLTLLVPVSAQIQLLIGEKPWLYYIGAGPGLYRIWVKDHDKLVRDPDPSSLALHQDVYWGFTAEAGAERFLAGLPSTSIELALASHFVFSEDAVKFPSGFNTNLGALALRVGVNYYFDLNQPKPEAELPLPGGGR